MRTAISQFSFSLIILRIFTAEFYPIGALFAVYGAAILLVAIYRRHEGNKQFFNQITADGTTKSRFRTAGSSVALLTGLTLCAYASLMVLMWTI